MGHEVEQQHWRCYAYCLLGNDSHFLLETPEGHLSSEMRRLNGTYMQAFNRRHQRGGHVLQGRFASILVEKDASLLELCRYIVLNPVRAKMVRTVQAWSWSSYRATVGRASIPPWLAVTTVHRLFHRIKIGAQQRYQQFVREGMKEPSPWAQVRGQIFLGNEAFLAKMAKLVKKQSLKNVPKAQTQPTRLTGEEVLAQVEQVYGLHPDEVLTRAYPEAYHCAAWLLRRIANEPLGVVAQRFGVSPSRISHIQRALETHGLSRQQAKVRKLCQVKQ